MTGLLSPVRRMTPYRTKSYYVNFKKIITDCSPSLTLTTSPTPEYRKHALIPFLPSDQQEKILKYYIIIIDSCWSNFPCCFVFALIRYKQLLFAAAATYQPLDIYLLPVLLLSPTSVSTLRPSYLTAQLPSKRYDDGS